MAWTSSPASESRSSGSEAPLEAARFRDVLSAVPTSVVVVTALDRGEPVGLAVGTFLSVSLDPPLVGFLPAATSSSFRRIRQAGAFCANVLTVNQQHVSQAFATSGADKFAGLSWRPAPATGSPVLEGVAAWIDCRITTLHEAGDHFIVLGEVADLDAVPGERPLVFHRRRYMGAA
ncbi:flavin reductase family protein [Streptomyces sp. A012304]|uniref:flavin reductase family protein n=1 Tax=Streptomyces sp. A012304 TaxID=375446 RepID=UPI002232075D|nr:flavin reductase family protein [Streptomyces sp. A012304]GKQ39151.1 monooxygenase [Streptomyces sp. A012304]